MWKCSLYVEVGPTYIVWEHDCIHVIGYLPQEKLEREDFGTSGVEELIRVDVDNPIHPRGLVGGGG